MRSADQQARLPGKLLMVGFGCIGQAVLPLLLRHLELRLEQITIVTASAEGEGMARQLGVDFELLALTEGNYQAALAPRLNVGDFLLNLSVEVSSLALLELCWQHGALYLDASIEPWAGGYTDPARSISQRSNYALREAVLAFARDKRQGPTALVTQGANPGLASCFVKRALMNLAAGSGEALTRPQCPESWAALAQRLGIRAIHIAERDTQTSVQRKRRDEFVNTWSVAGFIGEGTQPSELGWGSHERHFPVDGARHGFGSDAAIYLNRPGMATRVRSWTPLEGPFHGFLVTHGESISIADHLTLRKSGAVVYRPTVHYAYHPCDDAVLLMGQAGGVYWFGSRLSIEQARSLAPFNSATSLQVAAGVLAGMVWVLAHPQAGVIEPDDMDTEDPWQFKNVRVL